MIINLDSITIDKAIPGLNWTPSRCSTLADLLAALVAQAGSGQDLHAVSGLYNPQTESIVITLSNNSTFSIPASLLLPVVADGATITGNGTTANKLTGYKVEYDGATGALTITPPGGAPVTIPAQTALTEPATDTEGLLGTPGATVTTQQLMDRLALCCLNQPGAPIAIPDSAFSTSGNPSETAAQAWIQTNHPNAPHGQKFTYTTYGEPDGIDYIWEAQGDHTILRLEDLTFGRILVPSTAFADPTNPTAAEAQAWLTNNDAYPAGTLLVYPGSGTETDPDWVWLIDSIGDPINTESPALASLTTKADSKATVTGNTLNVPNPLPVANFVRTGKIGLTASYSAIASSGTQEGNPLTYQWTVAARTGTTGTATLDTPSANTTAVTFSAPGQYDVTLTVTDANGNTASTTKTIAVNRILEVASPDETNNDYLVTITAALAWKTANDPSNTYKILVRGNTTEPATITNADRAHIHFAAGASATFNGIVFHWTTAPVDLRLSADLANPYAPAIISPVNAVASVTIDGIDATNLIIDNIAILSAGRALTSNNTANLYLRNVASRTTGADPYNHAHTGGVNIVVENCVAIGVGIAFALVPAQGRANTMKLLHSYGEVGATPTTNTLAVLYTPGSIWAGTTQDILVMGNTLINNGAGNNASGVPRSVIVNGGSVAAVVTGARFLNNTLIQNGAGNPVIRSQSGDASKNTIPMLGNQLLGGVAFSNCASAVVTTTNSNNIL